MKYRENPSILGIVLYGSQLTGYATNRSDIDLHIIKNNDDNILIRGCQKINGFKIEYFEKPLSDLYLSADNDFLTQNNAMLPIIGFGKILYDSIGLIQKLQEYILKKYAEPLPPLEPDDSKEFAAIIWNRIEILQEMFEINCDEFDSTYYITLEKIRKLYSRMLGCPDIPDYKTKKLYTNRKYRVAFGKTKVPDEYFRKFYLRAKKTKGDKQLKMVYIHFLFNQTIANLNFDPENYRIKIKSRNDSNNRVHN
jgi:hypothetical protein